MWKSENAKMRKCQMRLFIVAGVVWRNAVNLIAGRERSRGSDGWVERASGQRPNQCIEVKVPIFARFTVMKRRGILNGGGIEQCQADPIYANGANF